jgi:hypothetical protein
MQLVANNRYSLELCFLSTETYARARDILFEEKSAIPMRLIVDLNTQAHQ